MSTVSAAVAVALAAVVGFSVHRASLCNVTGVAELLSAGRVHVLGSFAKTMLWVIAVTFVVERLPPSGAVRYAHLWAVSGQALAGGFIFGVGAANGVLFARFGSWTYTRTAGDSLGYVLLGGPAPGPFRWVLFAALLGGVAASGLARGDFAADWRPRAGWLVNLMGGALMGVGAALTPGGNDALILHGIPGGSPHAIPAYATLLIGTAAGLIVIKRVTGVAVEVECSGDICRVKKTAGPYGRRFRR